MKEKGSSKKLKVKSTRSDLLKKKKRFLDRARKSLSISRLSMKKNLDKRRESSTRRLRLTSKDTRILLSLKNSRAESSTTVSMNFV